ncbi:hypothetical protein D3C79_1103000 [compost metagenome]
MVNGILLIADRPAVAPEIAIITQLIGIHLVAVFFNANSVMNISVLLISENLTS